MPPNGNSDGSKLPLTAAFDVLANSRGWEADSWRYRKERSRFFVRQANAIYGTGTLLENLQQACEDIGLDGDMSSVTQCKKLLKGVHVNIIDLVDYRRGAGHGARPRRFGSLQALKQHSLVKDKIFPLGGAKEDSAIRCLLRPLSS